MNPYIKKQEKVIEEIINNVQIEYPGDYAMLDMVIDLTVHLQVCQVYKVFEDFIDGLYGFMVWCDSQRNSPKRKSVISTIIHDLKEFKYNKNEGWFLPRTHSYIQFST